ncbi:uncharacterized protein LOC143351833 [Colletes latitarsis]|uniref:uncharacterized protein LOC143351833 n=1 Tax=Colletes latitarsis TaxID=2605962 RepID=UPI00403588AC
MTSPLFKLIVTLVAVLGMIEFASSAAVRSEEFAEQVRQIVHEPYPDRAYPDEAYPDSLRTLRATESGSDKPKRNCYDAPCGWNAYDRITRRSKVFMANTCRCPDETYRCVHTGEILSMGAYVYHCRQNTTVDFDDGLDSADYVN